MRTCKICGKGPLLYGYCVDDGLCYYCSDKCLFMDFTAEEYLEAYEEDWAYYTEWDESEE